MRSLVKPTPAPVRDEDAPIRLPRASFTREGGPPKLVRPPIKLTPAPIRWEDVPIRLTGAPFTHDEGPTKLIGSLMNRKETQLFVAISSCRRTGSNTRTMFPVQGRTA